MNFRLSLLGAAAMAALFAQNPAHAGSYAYSTCSNELFSGLKCAINKDNPSRSHGLRDDNNDHGSDRDPGDREKDGGKGGDGGGGNGGGGNGGGGEGGEGGEGGS